MPGIRRLAVLLSLAAGAVLVAAATVSPGEPTFSRSRWIEEQEARGALFETGVLPATRPSEKVLEQPLFVPPKKRGPRVVWQRLSHDLLPPNGGSSQPETQAEPFLAVDASHETNLLAGYQEGRYQDGGSRALSFAVSTTGGKTWSEGLLPGLTTSTGGHFDRASDPWIAFGPGGRAYYVSILFNENDPANGVHLSSSSDGGKTWGPPVPVHLAEGNDFDDKEAVTVDTYADSPHAGRIYVAWDTVHGGGQQPILVARSDDEGASFSAPSTVADGLNIGAIPLVGPGGVVYVVWYRAEGFTDFAILSSRSEDGGQTWSPPVQVGSVLSYLVRDLRTGSLPTAAIDPRSGRLYVVTQDSTPTGAAPQIVLFSSSDGGRSWSPRQVVSDGPSTVPSFTPAVAVSGEGRVAVSYYSLRNDPEHHFLVDQYIALSKDGQTFAPSLRTTNQSWDTRFAARAGNGFFLGDYQGLAAGRKLFHSLLIAAYERSRIDPPSLQPDAFYRSFRP
jgi:hypothetical protein